MHFFKTIYTKSVLGSPEFVMTEITEIMDEVQCKCSVKEISDGPFRKLSGRQYFFQETSGDLSYLIVLLEAT